MSTSEPERDDVQQGDQRPELGIDPDLDFDAAFAALVAQFSAPDAVPDRAEPSLAPSPRGAERVVEEVPADEGPTAVADEPLYPAELDEHFEPPDPPPLPRGDLYSRLAWAGVIGGPALLLMAAFLGGRLPAMLVVGALLAFVAGFVTLVARMPGERPDDPDDGAVV